MTSKPGDAPAEGGRSAALLMAAQGLALLVLAGLLVVDAATGAVDDTTQALTEAALVLVFVAAAAAMAKGLSGGSGWARTPSLVWNLLLLPVAYSLFTSGQAAIGTVVLVIAVLTLVMVWRSPPVELPDDD